MKKYGIRVVCVVPGNQGSFIRESNIFTRQADHFEAMKWVMLKETQNFYGDYLYRYMKYFTSLVKNTTVQTIRDGRIYESSKALFWIDIHRQPTRMNHGVMRFTIPCLQSHQPFCVIDWSRGSYMPLHGRKRMLKSQCHSPRMRWMDCMIGTANVLFKRSSWE